MLYTSTMATPTAAVFKRIILFAAQGVILGVCAFAAAAALADWSVPSGNAPSNNTPAPLDISTTLQTKEGSLTVADTAPGSNSLTVGSGATSVLIKNGGVNANRYCLGSSCITTWGVPPTFITPVQIYSGSGVVSATAFDTTPYVPAGANGVILESSYALNGPDGGTYDAFIYVGKNASTPYILSHGRCAGQEDNCAGADQGLFPINSSGTIYYKITGPGFNDGASIWLIGYF